VPSARAPAFGGADSECCHPRFYGLKPGIYDATAPVFLTAEERDQDQFVLALTEDQRTVKPGSVLEATLRRYLVTETKRRLHQPVFASQVMLAYDTKCAICTLGHRELLDAAHIVPDSDPLGLPIIQNGLALCKMHHAAYDRNILGIRPDYTVEIHERLLHEIDGPMLTYGLQGHHGERLRKLPSSRAERPDSDRLAQRYAQFRAA
jgi:putative restriction endonuclease